MAAKTSAQNSAPKPIYLYDHLPGILAGYPAVMFLILSLLSLPHEMEWERSILSPDTIFWIGLAVAITWYIAFRFNLPKKKFWLVFGLMGTFVGIPIVLELSGFIAPFTWLGHQLGALAPSAHAGAWFVGALVFGIIWLSNFIWSRTHLRVKLDTSGLSIDRVGGKGERFDLIGLKTEDEPLDYLETFLAGIGSLSLKTRVNKPIFVMKRVVGLYRMPLMPWKPGKLTLINELLSFHGKVVSVDAAERADIAEAADATEMAGDDDALGEDDRDDFDAYSNGADDDVESSESPDIR